jgi:hypothetical protein
MKYTISQVISQIHQHNVLVRVMFDVREMKQGDFEDAIVTILQTVILHIRPSTDITTIAMRFPDVLRNLFLTGGKKWLIIAVPGEHPPPPLSEHFAVLFGTQEYWKLQFFPRTLKRELFSLESHVTLTPRELLLS